LENPKIFGFSQKLLSSLKTQKNYGILKMLGKPAKTWEMCIDPGLSAFFVETTENLGLFNNSQENRCFLGPGHVFGGI